MRYLSQIIFFLAASLVCTAQQKTDTISLYFDMARSALTAAQKQCLDSLSYYNHLDARKNYTVLGYCDAIGDEKYNRDLSVKRANTVAAYLQSLGIMHIDTVIGSGEIAKPDNTDGYPQDRRVDIFAGKVVKKTTPGKIDIAKMKKNETFNLENMIFYGGLATLKPESKPTLDSLLVIMKQYPKLKIRIEGHVHCATSLVATRHSNNDTRDLLQGSSDDKKLHNELSTARAKMVHDYLLNNNISQDRLQYAGLACKEMDLYPYNNRRVAVRILEK